VVAAARAAGAPVNIVDRPAFCDFQFGAIVNRSPLVVAISTGGAAPVFGQALRARIETMLPPGFAGWAEAGRRWRDALAELPFRTRRKFWEAFSQRALAAPDRAPSDEDRAAIVREAGAASAAPVRGKALLVGAGPGDPELLTLKAVRALQSADVVLYDGLVGPAILDMARREAEKIDVGKSAARASPLQAEITARLVELVAAGKTVVRLKGGDPMIFGRANEEIAALAAAGLDVEIVPGVTAASGAAAQLLCSLTDRDHAPRFQIVTAHGRDGGLPDLDWRALADPRASTAIYMGRTATRALAERLMAEGLAGETPVAVVDRATREDFRALRSTLARLAQDSEAFAPKGPTLLIVGAALDAVPR
ncbi:MAG: uroporphyrinogen-III C-methyltransferase, partial [Hyphomicrobiales bacterium]|nr:uroporphyrinogen-III C-methyltransferase [Hyphomicrobiales bacterium]